MSTPAAPPAPAPDPTLATPDPERRRAIASSFLGSAVEYYDFLLYGAAAGIVFPKLFFEGMDEGTATMMSYLTMLTGFVARPVGGLLFGHFGDRFGRKNMLVITLMMMGLVSVAVGLMPTAATIGIAAPILLGVLRLVQGFAVGGEWAGAMLVSMEHSRTGSKGIGASMSVAGAPFGAVLATLVLALFSMMPDEDFLSWGWRIPFLLSALVVVFGLYLRSRVSETPEFEEARRRGDVHTGLPIAKLLRNHGREVLFGTLAVIGPLFVQGLLAVFMVPYVVKNGAVSRDTALLFLTLSNAAHVFAIPFFAWLSDRFGRKQVMIAGALFSIVAIFPMFAMFESTNPTVVLLAFMLGNPLIQASMYGPVGAYLSELFDTDSRYSGVSGTYQIGSLLGAGLAPVVATELVTADAGTTNLAWYIVAMYVISAVGVLLSRAHSRQGPQTHAERFTETAVIE